MFLLVIDGTGVVQSGFMTPFPNTGKEAFTAPGNVFCLPTSPTTFDFDGGAANTHTTDNWVVPFPVEVVKINYLANAAQAFTNDNLAVAIGLPGSDVTTVALAIAGHTFADGGATGDVVQGTYSAAITGSNVMAANTLYEVGTVVRPTGGTVTAVTKGIQIWVRPIRSTSD